MRGDALARMENFDDRRGQSQINFASDKLVRDAVIMTLNLDMNWLQVSSFTKLPQIDQSEGHEFESEMTFLLSLKT